MSGQTIPVKAIRLRLLDLLKLYFSELRNVPIDIDTPLDKLNLGDTWLIEYIFVIEENYDINISYDMAKKHFVRIRNAAKYLSNRTIARLN